MSGWWRRAACRGRDTNLWFPEPGERANPEAVAICRGCEVKDECLDYSLSPLQAGVWGGLGERQRKRLRAARGREERGHR